MSTLTDLSVKTKSLFIRLNSKYNTLRRHALISAVTMALSISTVMFMTGVLFFTNDVLITQDGVTKKYFTMKEDGMEILSEFGYTLGEFDRMIHGKNEHGYNLIEIINGFGVEVTVDGSTFKVGAIPDEPYDIILAANGIEVREYDAVIIGDRRINVVRGFGVEVTADGKTVRVGAVTENLDNATVDEILQKADISVGVGDVINMPVDATVSEGDEVIVNRVTYRERTYVEEVPYETSIEYSNLVAMGNSEVTEGVSGEVTFIFREKLIDGVVVTSEVLSRKYTKEAQTEIITHGMALMTPYSKRDFPEIRLENGIPVDYIEVISGQSTAYTAPPTSGTASGRKLEIGTVAVNPNIIPYGSLLYIVTSCGSRVYGAAIAADTGGFINYTDRFVAVDLFMGLTSENYGDALRWGNRNVDVYVINTGVY